MLDGPASVAIQDEEWLSIKGGASLARHLAYLHLLGAEQLFAADPDDK
jgi:hypothetical protein